MKLSTCLFALAGLIAPSILSAQPADTTRTASVHADTTRADTPALLDETVTGEALRRRSRSNLVLAIRWLRPLRCRCGRGRATGDDVEPSGEFERHPGVSRE